VLDAAAAEYVATHRGRPTPAGPTPGIGRCGATTPPSCTSRRPRRARERWSDPWCGWRRRTRRRPPGPGSSLAGAAVAGREVAVDVHDLRKGKVQLVQEPATGRAGHRGRRPVEPAASAGSAGRSPARRPGATRRTARGLPSRVASVAGAALLATEGSALCFAHYQFAQCRS
jgi:hypothetical protein